MTGEQAKTFKVGDRIRILEDKLDFASVKVGETVVITNVGEEHITYKTDTGILWGCSTFEGIEIIREGCISKLQTSVTDSECKCNRSDFIHNPNCEYFKSQEEKRKERGF